MLNRWKRNQKDMSVQKDWRRGRQEILVQDKPVSLQQVNGVNGVVDNYFISTQGTVGQHFWALNLSSMPGQKKRLLNLMQAKTFLLNYASNSYPSRINIRINQVAPSKDGLGNLSHIIAVMVPSGPPTVVINPGNVIGYNISYCLLNQPAAVDISNIPTLTFDVTIGDQLDPVPYPIAEGITANIQITRVIF